MVECAQTVVGRVRKVVGREKTVVGREKTVVGLVAIQAANVHLSPTQTGLCPKTPLSTILQQQQLN
jgi:hypothetical protein